MRDPADTTCVRSPFTDSASFDAPKDGPKPLSLHHSTSLTHLLTLLLGQISLEILVAALT